MEMSKNHFFKINHMFGMPLCNQNMQKQWVLCFPIIPRHKTDQINLTARNLEKNSVAHRLCTLKKTSRNLHRLRSNRRLLVLSFYFQSNLRTIYDLFKISLRSHQDHSEFVLRSLLNLSKISLRYLRP